MKGDGRSVAGEHDDELPFALLAEPVYISNEIQDDRICSFSRAQNEQTYDGRQSTSSLPPGLASSVLSSPTDTESQASIHTLTSPDSTFLDTAASLLCPSLVYSRGNIDGWGQTCSQDSLRSLPLISSGQADGSDVGFSQLLQNADDTVPTAAWNAQKRRLPVLFEEQSVASTGSGRHNHQLLSSHLYNSNGSSLNHSSHPTKCSEPNERPENVSSLEDQYNQNRSGSNFLSLMSHTIIPAGPTMYEYRSEERRLASLAGATVHRTGDDSFVVSVEVAGTSSIRDVMDILGNPEYLTSWCDPVRDFILTRSSEGARDFENENVSRVYEGEWMQGTCSHLILPKNTSCMYSTSRIVTCALGFPTYGKISLFVERQLGQMGLTVGPFPGATETTHKIRVSTNEQNGKIRIVDEVRLQKDSTESFSSCYGIWGSIESLLLPTVDDYVDQVLSSIARLRFLIENGDTSMYATATEQAWNSTGNTPLLSGLMS